VLFVNGRACLNSRFDYFNNPGWNERAKQNPYQLPRRENQPSASQQVAFSGKFNDVDMPKIICGVVDSVQQGGGASVTEGTRQAQLLAAACGKHLGVEIETAHSFTDQELSEGVQWFRQDMAALLHDLKFHQEHSGNQPLDMTSGANKSREAQLLSAGCASLIGWLYTSNYVFTDQELSRVQSIYERL
jgi:hypothetical protein